MIMSNTSRRSSRLLVPVALVLSIAGCSRTLEMDTIKKSIADGVAAQVGLQVGTVTCPTEPREAKVNDEFECTVTPKEGGRLTIKVTQKDDQGNINWVVAKTEGLLDLAKVESSVQQGLKEQAEIDATVSCGGRWKGAKKGDTFDCDAKTTAGETVTVMVSVTDDNGNIEWGTR
jgi:hypothetical protein